MWKFKKVIVPAKNYRHSIDPRDYNIEVIAGETLEDYLKETFAGPEETYRSPSCSLSVFLFGGIGRFTELLPSS